ncbi:hypothetical protein SAMN04488243_10181 [Thermus arciformis]|uniref:Uncharacterized protein n=1 Tax=Thermus arciformis TaxID=482827 RepID=A0A1G7CM41_9DEIN|nr:hypothetical protein [Thermus arciformis]SDE40313.1 hypothetical protein SAMN04488243_10181 [Thermus arciformis]
MWSPWWDPEAGKGRHEALLREAEWERLLNPGGEQGKVHPPIVSLLREAEWERLLNSLRVPWRLRLARALLRWALRLAPEAKRELKEVFHGG